MAEIEVKLIEKLKLNNLLDKLIKEMEVIAPLSLSGGDVDFDIVKSRNKIMDPNQYVNDLNPIKRFFFPPTETMFNFKFKEKGYEITPVLEAKKRIIFGLRSCDVMGLNFMDTFFRTDFPDNYYLRRREDTTLISIGCSEPGEWCFCICGDCGPFLEKGYDIQLTDLGNFYLAEIGSEKGKKLVTENDNFFTQASEEHLERRKEIDREAENKFKLPTSYFTKAIKKVSTDEVPEKTWEEIGDRCFSCGGCAHVCPTCSCFTVCDIMTGTGEGKRQKIWDSCNYAGFTREASGHNPRATETDRVKRRFYHKLSYFYVLKQNGMHGCVGCGRCFLTCPGVIHLPYVVEKLRRT